MHKEAAQYHEPNNRLMISIEQSEHQSLADKAMLIALEYVSNSFYMVDDFHKPFKLSMRGPDRNEWRASLFEKMVKITSSDIGKAEYRRAFSRLISWVHFINKERGIVGVKYCFTKNAFNKESVVREMHEIFCRVLMQMGTLSDAVQVATEHASLVAHGDLANKIDEAITVRHREPGETLLKILVANEPFHPDIPRLRMELTRPDKIEKLQSSGAIDVLSIGKMTGPEFEQLVALMFEQLGFHVSTTPKTGDFGSDLILVSPNGSRISVQCKRFSAKVNLKAVQEVVASLSHYECDYGIVITNNDFLNSAKKLAENNEVELWDKGCLIDFLSGDISFSKIEGL